VSPILVLFLQSLQLVLFYLHPVSCNVFLVMVRQRFTPGGAVARKEDEVISEQTLHLISTLPALCLLLRDIRMREASADPIPIVVS
jgi:hypothetical protein